MSFDGTLLVKFQEIFVRDGLTPIVKFITHLGDSGIIWIVITAILLVFKKTRKAGVIAALALIGSLIINNLLLKNIVARTRPYDTIHEVKRLVEIQKDFSFPSGHSASSFAASIAIYFGLDGNLRKYLGIGLIVLAFAIAFSRLYVGVHYPLDVLVGSLDGVLIGYLAYKLIKRNEARLAEKLKIEDFTNGETGK